MHERILRETPTYWAWLYMRRRHLDGATAEVCARWAHFENFLADMGKRPRRTTLIRIDDKRAYGPGNCQWKASERQHDAIAHATFVELRGRQ